MTVFRLHPQLAADTYVIGDLELCRALLMNDKRYPWIILVPMREDMRDLMDLLPGDLMLTMREINRIGRILQAMFRPDKLNVAALGNITPQLHIHVIARFEKDAGWPKPVWCTGEAQKYAEGEAKELAARLKQVL